MSQSPCGAVYNSGNSIVAMPLAHIRLAGVMMTEEELNVQVQAAQDEIARLRETFGPAYAKLGEALYPVARETELAARFADEFAEVDAIAAAIDEQNAAIEAAHAEYDAEQARIAEEEATRAAEEAAR